jgi:hypothetical protein
MTTKDLRSFGVGMQSPFLTSAVKKHMQNCNRYVYGLSEFRQYCVWRYTIGSASINMFMIMGKLTDNAVYWVKLFISYLVNTGIQLFPFGWREVAGYMRDKNAFNNLNTLEQAQVASVIIGLYIKELNFIIAGSPPVIEEFHTYKVSSRYPGVPEFNDAVRLNGRVIPVEQLPFNSTSVNPNMNFMLFLAPNATCCLWDILIPVGSRVLSVPADLHAYSFEREVIFPPCVFGVYGAHTSILNGVSDLNVVPIQDTTNISMGTVFIIDETKPCKSGYCNKKSNNIETYDCIFKKS